MAAGGQGGVTAGGQGGTLDRSDGGLAPDGPTATDADADAGTPAKNAAPVVTLAAVQPTTSFAGTTVKLAGNVSDDGLPAMPGALTFTWSKVQGMGDVAFTTPAAASTTCTFSTPGSFVVRLTVSDGALQTTAEIAVLVSPVNTALLSQYAFDEGQGSTSANSVPGNSPATAASGSVWTTGHKGNGVNCTGGTNTFLIPDGDAVDAVGKADSTIAFWVKSSQAVPTDRYPQLFYRSANGVNLEVLLYTPPTETTEVVFRMVDGAKNESFGTPIPIDGQWHHVAVRRRGDTVSLAVDGMTRNSRSVSIAGVANSPPLLVCGIGEPWGQFFGALDDVRIYGRALEDRELMLLQSGSF